MVMLKPLLISMSLCCLGLCLLLPSRAVPDVAAPVPVNLGPYDVTFLEGGIGLTRALETRSPVAAALAPWTMSGWLRMVRRQPGRVVVAAVGNTADTDWRGLVLADGELECAVAPGLLLRSATVLEPGRWYAVAASYDGTIMRVYVDGEESAHASAATAEVAPRLELAPASASLAPGAPPHFGGSLALFTLTPAALTAEAIRSWARTRPDFSLITFNPIGVGWPLQEHAWRGLQEPQDPWTLPRSNSAPAAPVAVPVPADIAGLRPENDHTWTLDRWELAAAPAVTAGGDALSQPSFPEHDEPRLPGRPPWYPAVVPGTVLTTLIARGVYPDPDHGLDNMAIPESLSRQDYWYRSRFVLPAGLPGRDLILRFNGINYAADVWVNGRRVGDIHGAFTRGTFDVTGILRAGGDNAIAVRIAPPPHPGIAHEQSMAAGPGNNGGAMALDGPTFIASEGWDWIPGIRDRNTGLWQSVELLATGPLQLHDAQVITHLPLPRTDSADLTLVVPVENRRSSAVSGSVVASVDGVRVEKRVALQPGLTEVRFDADEFRQLHLTSPRLWWPNGYGPANLHTLQLAVNADGAVSDSTSLRFGIRELTYELSLFDHDGRLRRVEVDPTLGTLRGERLVDVRHEAIKRSPQGWAESLTPAAERSPAVHALTDDSLAPYLVIRVNGVPIAARGGSWGMDDSRKRISREKLEPYFKLEHDAHLNIIRNWLGQNTEEVFYQLADEYGFLVLNDFWVSTQEFQLEPEDAALFLANARDVISRYRNHPSIAVWFGRNEGVPPPILNTGLADLVATLDGTRYYTGSSNEVNLQGSGPYNYRAPQEYFTGLARGFSVEVGTPSLSTLESLRAAIPAADRWPLNDTFAYHDWHYGGNGDVESFMAALAQQYGEGTSLEDFERKAQLMDYVSYRAIFEGFQAHLWTQNSGRLLWMTHPSWPSNTWQIYSADYDTAAAYYAVMHACEPLHAQLNLPDFRLTVVNGTREDRANLTLRSRVLSLDNRVLLERVDHIDARANAVTTSALPLALSSALAREALVLVSLTLSDAHGATVSHNVYWQSGDASGQRRLNDLKAQPVALSARLWRGGSGGDVEVKLTNTGAAPALNAKITMLGDDGARVLPVYYSDNYVTLLPGETRHLVVSCASSTRCARIALRGWNVIEQEVAIAPAGTR